MATKKESDQLLTVPEAAEIAGLDRSALARIVKAGRLKSKRVGPIYIIERRDLEEWMEGPDFHKRAGRPSKT